MSPSQTQTGTQEYAQSVRLDLQFVPANFRSLYNTLVRLENTVFQDRSQVHYDLLKTLRANLLSNSQRRIYHELRANYNANKSPEWHSQFVFVRKLIADRLKKCETTPNRLRNIGQSVIKNWNELPDSKFKRIQQAFSHGNFVCLVRDFVVQPYSKDQKRAILNTASVLGCVLSPDRISNRLLAGLRIANWTNLGIKDKLAALEYKSKTSVINALKLCIDSSRPITEKNLRVLIVSQASQDLLNLYSDSLAGYAIPNEIIGSILYTSEKKPIDQDLVKFSPRHFRFTPLNMQFFPTVYEAYRKTLHLDHRQTSEIEKISGFIAKLNAIIDNLKQEWSNSTERNVKQKLQQKSLAVVTEISQWLKAAKDKNKVAAYNKLFATFLRQSDSVKLDNPVASLIQMRSALIELKNRQADVMQQSPHNKSDNLLFRTEMKAGEEVFVYALSALANAPRKLNVNIATHDQPASVDAPEIFTDLTKIKSILGLNIKQLTELKFRPFNTFARKLSAAYQQIDQVVQNAGRSGLSTLLNHMYEIASLAELNRAKEKILANLAEQKIENTNELLANWQAILNWNKRPSAYQGLAQTSKDITEIKDIIKHFDSALQDTLRNSADFNKTLAAFKGFLKNGLNIEQIVTYLPMPEISYAAPKKPK